MIEHIRNDKGHFVELDIMDMAQAYEIMPSRCDKAALRDMGQVNHDGIYERAEWVGAKDTKEACERLDKGWPEGARKIQALSTQLGNLELGVRSRKRIRRVSDEGDEFRIDQILQQDYDHAFITRKREVTSGSTIVDLFCQVGGNSGLNNEQLFYPGATAIIVADILENAGYSVGITGTWISAQGNNTIQRIDIKVKDPHEPLRIDAVAGILCASSTFRGPCFKAMEMYEHTQYGHGRCNDYCYYKPSLQSLNIDIPSDAILTRCVYNEAAVIEEVKRVLGISTLQVVA